MKTLFISAALILSAFMAEGKESYNASPTPFPNDTVRSIVCPLAPRQTLEGWGVSLCWWANMCGKWSDPQIDELVDWMVNPEGLNWNLFRYNIGGGEEPNWANCKEHHWGTEKD